MRLMSIINRRIILVCVIVSLFLVVAVLGMVSRATTNTSSFNPIQHVVVIFKENHTFDNYFGTFPGVNGLNLALDCNSAVCPFFQKNMTPADLGHDWTSAHSAWSNGTMQGFIRAEFKNETMSYYNGTNIPFY